MAFDTYEESLESSQPVELYTFTIGSTITRYTSAEDDIVEAADTFTATAIRRQRLTGGGPDARTEALVIEVPGDNAIAIQYINSVPGIKADVRIERIQRLDGPAFEVKTIFEGRISAVAFEQGGRLAKINVVPRIAAVSRPIPRFIYSNVCNHVLYDSRCQVDDTDPAFRLSSELVTAEVGNVITVSGANLQPDGYYTGGFVEAQSGLDHRLILAHVGNDLTLHLPFSTPVNATLVNVFAGCDHTIATCKSKFDNVINFGGFAFVPTKNIFQTGLTI